MNKLNRNPNIRRFGLPFAVTAALIGGAACTPKNIPTPVPSETTTSAAGIPQPSCTIEAEVKGKTATFNLDTKDEYEPGVYTIEKVEYAYGDGQSNTNASHSYAKAGSYVVRASMVMDVAPGPNVGAPFRDGFAVSCTPATVTIG
jgi:hypothetical protein